MKTMKYLWMVALIGILISCGTTKNHTSKTTQADRVSNQQKQSETVRNQTNTDLDRNNTRNNLKNRNVTANRATSMDAERNQKMYKNLGMNPNQIQQYESQWTKARNDFQKNNSDRKQMNSFERTEHQDRIMKEILDDSQFVRYQQWVRDNPYEDVDENHPKNKN